MDRVNEMMDKAEERARYNFKNGLNCAESVVQAIIDVGLTDLPPEFVAVASGFGGGIGHTKNICGAISGCFMAVSSVKGRKNPFEKETLPERAAELNGENGIYKFFARIVKEIEEKYGTLLCRELTKSYDDFTGKPRKKNCMEITAYCARLAAKYICEE